MHIYLILTERCFTVWTQFIILAFAARSSYWQDGRLLLMV